jgi:hypothetical protein
VALSIFVVLGLVLVGLFTWHGPDGMAVTATGLMFAGAALVAGALLGFLFGVPRTLAGDVQPPTDTDDVNAALTPGYSVNTNLEQISDWLTKIIVGVGLIQLGAIRGAAGELFDAMAPSLGGPASAPFAGALTVYFAVVGFAGGWLLTRLFLLGAMSAADRRARALTRFLEAERATAAGDDDRARQLREQAIAGITSAEPAATQHKERRRNLSAGLQRTTEMQQIIEQARGNSGKFSPEQVRALFDTGEDGLRLYALGLMQGNEELADFPAVLQAIEAPRSAVEQYNGMAVAQQMLPGLSAAQKDQLAAALGRQRSKEGSIRPRSDRWQLSDDLLDAIGAN